MTRTKITPEEALAYHLEPRPGKYDMVASTPMATQRDLSLAYQPRRGGAGAGDRR